LFKQYKYLVVFHSLGIMSTWLRGMPLFLAHLVQLILARTMDYYNPLQPAITCMGQLAKMLLSEQADSTIPPTYETLHN